MKKRKECGKIDPGGLSLWGLKKCEECGKKEKKGLTTPFLDGI
jgi:hypothetical protein